MSLFSNVFILIINNLAHVINLLHWGILKKIELKMT
jgi:hypothetical protein